MPDTPQQFDRRRLLKTALGVPAIGLPLAAVLADPNLARAQADSLETVSLTVPSGRTVSASLAMPADLPAGAVLLIHEWWGLNDQIKTVAAALAQEGYVALAVDLMGGEVATTPDQARALTGAVNPSEATETLTGWVDWLQAHERTTGKVATIGWCFGGAWSFNVGAATPVDGTIIYYGRVPGDVETVSKLQGPVLGHFGTQDGFINRAMVDPFEAALEQAGKDADIHWYDANHAFANPTSARYDSEDAALSWSRTLAFLDEVLG